MDSSSFPYATRLPNSLFRTNREKFLDAMKDFTEGICLFKGKEELMIDSTDIDYEVKQESFFYYLFGVQELGCHAAIDLADTSKAYLFVPKMDDLYKIWMKVLSLEELRELYPDFEILYMHDLESWLKGKNPSTVYVNHGVNSDSGNATLIPDFSFIKDEEFKTSLNVEKETMHDILAECRVLKSPEEVEILKLANQVTSEAHIHAMRNCKAGLRESYLSSKFKAYGQETYNCKILPYHNICACGPNPSTLHYIVNDDILPTAEMCLMDMGHAVQCYGADVTCCYPTNGTFTQKQKEIYNLVVKSNRIVMSKMKPGVTWPDMHTLAETVIMDGLKELGLVKGDTDELIEKRVPFIFMPHGLGHLIGIDTHDVGGYLKTTPPRSDKWGLKNLRTARTLEEGMCITVEPGCYFVPSLIIDRAVDIGINIDDYVDVELAKEYMKEVSGVRIEDCVMVTADGCENITKVPRTTDQIEACMRGEDWTKLPEFEI